MADEKVIDKEYEVIEFVPKADEARKGSLVMVAFADDDMSGYFMDWFDEVGREQFDGAIMDL